MKKKLSKTLWYGTDVDTSGKPIVPPFTDDPSDLNGLHIGELFIHYANGKSTLWTANENGNVVSIVNGDSVDLSGYLLKEVFDKLWSLQVDSNGNEYILGKLPLAIAGGVTMYADSDNLDIPSIYAGLPIDDRTIVRDENGVLMINPGIDLGGGLDEVELTEFLTTNGYAKKSDIPSLSGYATQSWVEGKGYAKKGDIPSLSGYATETYVEDRLDDLINGAPAAYDTLKEIADVLAGNVDSIGDIITTLGTKADKAIKISAGTGLSGGGTLEADRTFSLATSGVTAGTYKSVTVDKYGRVTSGTNPTTLAGYGITDAYTKTAVNDLLASYVTLAGAQTITGEKDFTGGLKVNGSPIVYNSEKGYWKLEGDLLVTGGVSFYSSDTEYVPSTIMSALLLDDSTLGINSDGQLYVKGNLSGATTLGALSNVGTWANSVADVDRIMYQAAGSSMWVAKSLSDLAVVGDYLPLSGGTLTLPNRRGLIINRTDENKPVIAFFNSLTSDYNYLGFNGDTPIVMKGNGSNYPILHTDNYSNYALPLSGGELNGKLTIRSSSWGDELEIIRANSNGDSLILYSNNSGRLGSLGFCGSAGVFPNDLVVGLSGTQYKVWHSGNDGSGSGLDADLLDGKNLKEIVSYTLNPSSAIDLNSFTNGEGFNIISFNLASSVNVANKPNNDAEKHAYAVITFPSRYPIQLSASYYLEKFYLRRYYSYNGWSNWKTIAFTDSNVESATKLQTARTIWGQSFDGTGNVDGKITLTTWDSDGTALRIGNGAMNNAYVSFYSYTGNAYTVGQNGARFLIRHNTYGEVFNISNGNVGIGTNSPDYKLHVVGGSLLSQSANGNLYYRVKGVNYVLGFGLGDAGVNRGIYDFTNTSWMIYRDSSTNVLIPQGNVGIGTTNPQYKLDVNGTFYSKSVQIGGSQVTDDSKSITFLASDNTLRARISYNGNTTDGLLNIYSKFSDIAIKGRSLQFYYNEEKLGLYLNSSGKVTIGSSDLAGTSCALYVDGETKISKAIRFVTATMTRLAVGNSTDSLIFGDVNGNTYIRGSKVNFQNVTGTNVVTIADGNVGIGTTSPSENFEVNGGIWCNTILKVNNSIRFSRDGATGIYRGNNATSSLTASDIYVNAGTLRTSGNILAEGGVTFYSQRSLKNVIDERGLSLNELSIIKPTRYTWKDGRDDRLHFGGIADDIQQVLPEVVYKTGDNVLTMDYGNAAFAIASSLIKPVVDHEQRIVMLEKENRQLKQEIERLKSA